MKTVLGAAAAVLAFFGLFADAQAEEPADDSLQTFLLECDDYLDDCRVYMNDFILSGIKMSNNPQPVCIPLERNKAADMMISRLSELERDPFWAEEPYGNAMMQAMTDAFPCLTDY
ncbi:hypothetical protein [Parvibaculum sp.]|jgi:hypothetical protein|uniref:hypothetical protein n=1 Tax=Parvibaculum sp. TaxID=2024848 RepID=UPI001B041B03|nr:hypothetical protein [Parvibaculum sp.]MBO6634230.1 hypothetical protein [Parvibaculum sp.]MBO6679946.1 hypothetical protein [Parvibaculum sp.]MBO6683510.1 hypothetical protein [Parvibaculum sp.]MBO6905039.1 hypothetical protein [Parvibaculum sp.]